MPRRSLLALSLGDGHANRLCGAVDDAQDDAIKPGNPVLESFSSNRSELVRVVGCCSGRPTTSPALSVTSRIPHLEPKDRYA